MFFFSAVRNHSRDIVARFRNSREALIGEKLLIDKLELEINVANNS